MTRSRRLLLLALLVSGCSLVVREPAPEPGREADQPDTIHWAGVTPIASDKVAPGDDGPYWAKIRAGQPLVIGINPTYPPFGVRRGGGEGPAWAGFDIELAQHLGETLGVPVQLEEVTPTEFMDRLQDGSIDVAIAGLTRTVHRAAQVNFTDPYVTVSQAALIERRFAEGSQGTDEERRRDSMKSYYDLAGEQGIRIAVKEGTRPHRLALQSFPQAQILPFPSIDEASDALVTGKANALVHDDPYVRVWSYLNPTVAGRYKALLEPVTQEPIAMAIRKGDLDFLHFLNTYVDEVRHDGTIDRLYRRNFVDAVWLEGAELQRAEAE